MPTDLESLVDVRVVNDLAGQKDVAVGEAPPCLIRIVDRPIDAVAEAELARQMDREPARAVLEIPRTNVVDDPAVVRRRELAGDGLFHVEALAENERLGGGH